MKTEYFNIAGLNVCLRFADDTVNNLSLLPSFSVFQTEEVPASESLFFTLTVDDSLKVAPKKSLVRKFDTGNGDTVVYQLPDGGYQYIIRDIYNRDCCLLITNEHFTQCQCALNGDHTMRSFGLNDALMLIFAFAGSFHQTLLIHASCIMRGDTAYPCIAPSGTGKSTHTALWLKHIEGCELLNDDNPVLRVGDDGVTRVYGSPWSGKTPCYRNLNVPVGAIVSLRQAKVTKIYRQSMPESYASVYVSFSGYRFIKEMAEGLHITNAKVVSTVSCYMLDCLPNAEAAFLCYQTVSK